MTLSARSRAGAPIAALVFLLALLLTLATAKSRVAALYPPRPGQAVVVFLIDNGWHSDIAVPTATIEARGGALGEAARLTSSQPWTLIGWGDRDFYEASTPAVSRIPDGMAALMGGRPTVVHLEGVWGRPDQVWTSGVRRIALSPAGLAALLARADQSLTRGPGGAPVISPIHREPGEAFFASQEHFSLAHLCNHWTAELLHAAGLPVTPVLDTLPAGLALDLRWRAGA